jgi:hypothetical protein
MNGWPFSPGWRWGQGASMSDTTLRCCVWDIPTFLVLFIGLCTAGIWILAWILDWITKHFHTTIVTRFPGPGVKRRRTP